MACRSRKLEFSSTEKVEITSHYTKPRGVQANMGGNCTKQTVVFLKLVADAKPAVSPYMVPAVIHMFWTRLEVTKARLECLMPSSQPTGCARVGCLDNAATPFQPPEEAQCNLMGTGYPQAMYLKSDCVILRLLRALRVAAAPNHHS